MRSFIFIEKRYAAEGQGRCRCHNEITMVKAAKLAHHRRKNVVAERIEALREWRFAQPSDEDAPGSPSQNPVRRSGSTIACNEVGRRLVP